jgi:hypothetical protein
MGQAKKLKEKSGNSSLGRHMGPMVTSQYKATSAILSTLFVNETALKTTLHISKG